MKPTKTFSKIALFSALTLGGTLAHASVAYNTNGWDSGTFPGASGFLPPTWIGGATPDYKGSLNIVWYADLSSNSSEYVSSGGAIADGADPLYELAVGPQGWQRTPAVSYPNQGMGHGADIGLITLENAGLLVITVSADSQTPSNPSTVIIPGFSLFQGWDTSTTANQVQAYFTNQNNPLGTENLNYVYGLGGTSTTLTYYFDNLSAGNYTLILGGNGKGGHGDYSVGLSTAVPIPAAFWLFGGAMAFLYRFKSAQKSQ